VDIWTVLSDPKTGGYTHTVRGGAGHSLLVPVVCSVFQALRVSASMFDGRFWWSLHSEPNLTQLEVEHCVESHRWAYNGRLFAKVTKQRTPIRGTHAGYSDLFVPVTVSGKVVAVLVVGPFADERPSSASILERWRKLTGRQGHPSDPEFATYLRMTLSTLVLDGQKPQLFEQLLTRLAKLIAGEGPADELANQAHSLRLQIEPARFVDRMWEAVSTMIDERSSRAQYSAAIAYELVGLGLSRAADQVLVGLAINRAADPDPVGEAVRRDAFQRAAALLARNAGHMVAGRLGDHGVVFVSASRGSAEQRKKVILSFASRAATVARQRFALSLHFGASLARGSVLVAHGYQAALAAAESALTQGAKIVIAEPAPNVRPPERLREMREELGHVAEEHPELLTAHFERYIEAASLRSAHSIEPTRTQLEIAFERVADQLSRGGALTPKSRGAMQERLERAAGAARTLSELGAAYRAAIADLADAIRRPVAAGQDRSLRGALEYIHQHYGERLELPKVARVAGFTPKYFSQLFHQRERMTFERYLAKLRLERAKQLLSGTDLTVTRVAELSGYGSAQYFCRVFRRVAGVTPVAFRRGLLPHWARKNKSGASA